MDFGLICFGYGHDLLQRMAARNYFFRGYPATIEGLGE
jgi:hypothetical protein